MDVSDLVRRLLRRWAVVLAVVVVALAAAAVGWGRTGQTRQTVAAVVIVPPKFGGTGDVAGQNPLLNLDNNLAQLATVLAQAMRSSSVADALEQNGATGSFAVSTVTGTNPSFSQLSPQLEFTVTGSDERQTLFSARTIVAQARVQLAALQDRAGVAASARATLVESAEPTSAEVVSGSRLRVAGSLGLGVLVLGLLVVLAVDSLLGRRRLTSRARSGATVDSPATPGSAVDVPGSRPPAAAAARQESPGGTDALLDLDRQEPSRPVRKAVTAPSERTVTPAAPAAPAAPATQAATRAAETAAAATTTAPRKTPARTAAARKVSPPNGAASSPNGARRSAAVRPPATAPNGTADPRPAEGDLAAADPRRAPR